MKCDPWEWRAHVVCGHWYRQFKSADHFSALGLRVWWQLWGGGGFSDCGEDWGGPRGLKQGGTRWTESQGQTRRCRVRRGDWSELRLEPQMSALWRELAQIKTSGPIPQASDSISWGWGPGIGVSDEPLGDADAGGLGGTGKPRGFDWGGRLCLVLGEQPCW